LYFGSPNIAKGFNTLCGSHDGRYVAAAEVNYVGAPGSDTIRVFDLAERTEILALTPHDCTFFLARRQTIAGGIFRRNGRDLEHRD